MGWRRGDGTGVVVAVVALLVGCGNSAEAPPVAAPVDAPVEAAPTLQTGWMVIVTGSKDRGLAREQHESFVASGPVHGGYPQLVDSATVDGLKAGFHIVVAGVPGDKAVAEEMAAALGVTWEGTYIREVRVPSVETVTCISDPRCVRPAADALQVLGLRPGDGTSMNGNRVTIDGDATGPVDQWTRKERLDQVAGRPTLFEVYAGGGEGDCQTSMVQFEADGKARARLFFDSYCFGDTSEVSTAVVPRDGTSFLLRTVVDRLDNPEMKADGTWTGTPVHEETDLVVRWADGRLVWER